MQACNRRGLVDLEELITWGQASLDIFCLRDQSLEESDQSRLDVLVREIVEDLEAALEQFREIAADLGIKDIEP
jgi:type I restriction enzyme M protein